MFVFRHARRCLGRRPLPPGASAAATSVAGVGGEKKGDSGKIQASETAGVGTRSGDGDRSVAAALPSGLVTGIQSALTPRTLYVAACVLVWYGLSTMYSVYNAAVLRVFPFPLTVLTAELAAGVLLVIFAWVLGVIRTPSLRVSQVSRASWPWPRPLGRPYDASCFFSSSLSPSGSAGDTLET